LAPPLRRPRAPLVSPQTCVAGHALNMKRLRGNLFVGPAKFAPTSADPRRIDSFYELPRTRSAAEADGWACAEDGLNTVGYDIFCRHRDYRVCLLYDGQGSVAGIQIAVNISTRTLMISASGPQPLLIIVGYLNFIC